MLTFQRINNQLPHSSENREFKLLALILSGFFFICFPLVQIYFKDSFFLQSYWNLFFFTATLTALYFSKKLNFSQLGLSSPDLRSMRIGLIVGIFPVVAVIALDLLLVKMGFSKNDLFSGAELREASDLSIINSLIAGVINPTISQIFITGYVLSILANRNDMAIAGNGIIYATMNFNWGIGYLGLGMISAALLRFSGSIIPAIFFAIGCSTAKILILTSYPRITTLLVFLV